VNYLDPEKATDAVARGVARIRSWSRDYAQVADDAEELAPHLQEAQRAADYAALPRQLVHGDFWDNNALYRDEDIVLIQDFDHMGERARIEDPALTAYYMAMEPGSSLDPSRFRRLVDAYDAGLDAPLSEAERSALPVALARQPLWWAAGSLSSTTRMPHVLMPPNSIRRSRGAAADG
jgi:Ser/Thr protein kinase RdoA (MazF antagonist)